MYYCCIYLLYTVDREMGFLSHGVTLLGWHLALPSMSLLLVENSVRFTLCKYIL